MEKTAEKQVTCVDCGRTIRVVAFTTRGVRKNWATKKEVCPVCMR